MTIVLDTDDAWGDDRKQSRNSCHDLELQEAPLEEDLDGRGL